MWYDRIVELQEEFDVELVGLIQEQHPDRCALFLQWQKMDFPILVDTLDRTGVAAVPLLWALDEHGIVRAQQPDFDWFRDEFLTTEYPPPGREPAVPHEDAAVQAFLAGHLDEAVEKGCARVAENPAEGAAWFRLGAAYRARFDLGPRHPGDVQRAVEAFGKALELEPNHYIYRRRVQQYGPALEKPYAFYDWVARARDEIRERGETPVPLVAEPAGAELALPVAALPVLAPVATEPDPEGHIRRDPGLVTLEPVASPYPAVPGTALRFSVLLAPDAGRGVQWSEDLGPCQVVLEVPAGFPGHGVLVSLPEPAAAAHASRLADWELALPAALEGEVHFRGYALYSLCEGEEGACVYLRQDFELTVPVSSKRR